MPNLSELAKVVKETGKPPGTWALLVYGSSKTGKTALAATICKVPYIKKVAFFDLENGSETMVTMARDKTIPKELQLTEEQAQKVTIYRIPDTVQMPMAMETVLKVLTVRQEHIICEEHGKISCVVCADKGPDGKVQKLNGQAFDIRTFGPEDVIIFDTFSQFGNSILSYYMTKNSVVKAGWDEYGPQGQDLHNALCIIPLVFELPSCKFHSHHKQCYLLTCVDVCIIFIFDGIHDMRGTIKAAYYWTIVILSWPVD